MFIERLVRKPGFLQEFLKRVNEETREKYSTSQCNLLDFSQGNFGANKITFYAYRKDYEEDVFCVFHLTDDNCYVTSYDPDENRNSHKHNKVFHMNRQLKHILIGMLYENFEEPYKETFIEHIQRIMAKEINHGLE